MPHSSRTLSFYQTLALEFGFGISSRNHIALIPHLHHCCGHEFFSFKNHQAG
ncbi:hypothetical protein HanPI659440_Chr14g0555261 [Helianthus annuus]|nr:hypothetical protein HanPI659440_Chr14g0555261 [Helianthus annuus]